MQADSSPYPTYQLICEPEPETLVRIYVLTMEESAEVPESHRCRFQNDGKAVVCGEGLIENHYVSSCKASKYPITVDSFVKFSAGVSKLCDYWGISSDLLTNPYKFTRKSHSPKPLTISLDSKMVDYESIIKLVQTKNRSKEWANSRGDEDGVPAYFEEVARNLIKGNDKLSLTVIKGDELKEKNFGLMHAVGRASKNPPAFINLSYRGNPESEEWVAFVGKGVCFDSGGLNIKSST
jgi:leucyl aminopeptidase